MSDAQEKISMLQQGQKVLKEKLPGVMNNFMGVSQSVMQDGKLSKREKQLIAIAVTVAIHCETWIAHHVKQGLDIGLSVEEILEACSVPIMTGGGPSIASTSYLIKTLKELGAMD